MKKFSFVLFTVLLCTAFVVAQSSGGAGSSAASGQSRTAGSTGSASDQAGQTSTRPSSTGAADTSQTATSSNTANTEKGKAIEGCIVKESSEFYLQPKRGKLERLSSTDDLSAHVGHQVKVHGRESKATETTSSNTAAGASSTAPNTGGVSGQSTASGTQPSTSNPSATGQSSVAGSSGTTGASGGMTMDKSKISDKMITVERVEMVSETCNIGEKNKTKSDTTKY